MNRLVIIGTRGSELALWQANFVRERLKSLHPNIDFAIEVISTTGDTLVDVSLSKIGDKGLFTRQIEEDLLEGRIDLAVHSLKDLQTSQPAGLKIGAVCEREVPNDALISRDGRNLSELPEGAAIATGSLRRRSQLLAFRQDLRIVDIRGNVPTRLKKFDGSGCDALVLAYAGLARLGLSNRIAEVISTDIMLPAVGQGAVAVEVRDVEDDISAMVARLDDQGSRTCVAAERSFLRRLEGGCQVPIGAHATMDGLELSITGYVGSLDGSVTFRKAISGAAGSAEELGEQLAEALVGLGAGKLLDKERAESQTGSPG